MANRLDKYCTECGNEMNYYIANNEESFEALLGNLAGDAYNYYNGERLYRLEIRCPTSPNFWSMDRLIGIESHKIIRYKSNLTKEEIMDIVGELQFVECSNKLDW